jgi:16S rRNA processing protein RimM
VKQEQEPLVIVGRIRRAHGVKGVVVVEAMTGGADEVFSAGRQFIAGTVKGEAALPEKTLHVEMAEPFQGGFRVQFTEIADRNEADRWRNRYVLAHRDELPEPDEDEIYLHDLVGLRVEDQTGATVGQVLAYYELPHDVMVEVGRPNDTVMVPYRFVTTIDLEGKRIVIDPPDGLL